MPRQTESGPVPDHRTEPPSHLEQFASYEDGTGLVICDRKSPKTWIRSDATVPIEA